MLLDLADRCALIASLPHGGVAVEVGVASGDFSESILRLNRPQLLWLVDCWEHQSPEVCGDDPANVPQHVQDELYRQVCQRFNSNPRVRIIRAYSVPASQLFTDGTISWVFLDGNHLLTAEDIVAWWPKIKPDGHLCGHDYTTAGDYIRVRESVDEFVARTGLPLQVTGRDSPDVYERNYPSWAVQKPCR